MRAVRGFRLLNSLTQGGVEIIEESLAEEVVSEEDQPQMGTSSVPETAYSFDSAPISADLFPPETGSTSPITPELVTEGIIAGADVLTCWY